MNENIDWQKQKKIGNFNFIKTNYKTLGQRLIGFTVATEQYCDEIKIYQANIWFWRYGYSVEYIKRSINRI